MLWKESTLPPSLVLINQMLLYFDVVFDSRHWTPNDFSLVLHSTIIYNKHWREKMSFGSSQHKEWVDENKNLEIGREMLMLWALSGSC